MNEPQAGRALPCTCGDPERIHQWASVELSGVIMVGPCAKRTRLPRASMDEAMVRFDYCPCKQYVPDVTK